VRLPARVRSLGTERPLVALNTVYFFPVRDDQDALALSALLAALPGRVFARSIAERAKDARFRFLAWTIGAIPLPAAWREPANARRLADLGERAHVIAAGGGSPGTEIGPELDEVACGLLELSRSNVAALSRFDRWLSGHDRKPARELSA
jgi:hypothetical protein